MSFGYSAGDAILLTQVAWKTVQNTRKACGEHDELTKEVLSLHIVLRRLEQEYSNAESPLNRSNDTYKEELQVIGRGCERVLRVLNTILEKYNRLSEEERSWRKLWQKIKFGNGQVADLQDLRSKMITYTSAMSLFLNMVSLGSVGRIEQQMSDAGGELQEIKLAIHSIAAHLISKGNNEGSVLTSYTNDDKSVWKEFRRELRREGFASSGLKKNKTLIVAYIKELGDRGLFDDDISGDLKTIEELEASDAQLPTEDLSGEDRPKSSSAHQPFLTVESTPAVLHKDYSVSELGQHLFQISDDTTTIDGVSGNIHDARLTTKLSKDDKSKQCLAETSEMTSVSEVPTVDSKALDGTDIPLKRKPLHSYAESVADDELTEEFDDTEPFPRPQVTQVNVSRTAATPTSHEGPSADPIESVKANHPASNPLSTRSQGSITRTPSTESMEVKSAKNKRFESGSKIATFYVATKGFCLAWDDLDASSLLDRFEDRIDIIIDCQRVAWRFWDEFEMRLNQFVTTANVIISNINGFLATLGPDPGYCKCYSKLAYFTPQPFKVGILSLLEDGSSDFEDVRDILINVNLWILRFDENCGSIVFSSKKYLTGTNPFAMSHPRNVGLREFWAMPSSLRSTTSSMEGTYQRPAYFSLHNEGPTPPELLLSIRFLAEKKRLRSSVPRTEWLEQLGRYEGSYEGSPQLSDSGDTEGSSDYSDRVSCEYGKD